MRWFPILCVGLLVYGGYNKLSHRAVSQPDGIVTAAEEPLQTETRAPVFEYRGYTIKPLADFQVTARTLSTQRYSLDREAELSPIDLALGWGRMSDSGVIDQLHISQSGRFFFWRYDNQPPIPTAEIVSHGANMHMIPATPAIEQQLQALRPGEIVSFSGLLIEASASDGWSWRSSLSRSDSGAGACEVVWVDAVRVVRP